MPDIGGKLSAARISLILSGEAVPPERIAEVLGYEPTRLIRKGQLVSRLPALKAAESEWRHAVPLTNALGKDDDLDAFLADLIEKRPQLKQLEDGGMRVTLRLYVQGDSVQMVYQLTPDTLRMLSKLGMSLEVSSLSWGEVNC